MEKQGIIRFIISLIICFSVCIYNFYGFLKPLYNNDVVEEIEAPINQEKVETTTKEEKKETEPVKETTEKKEDKKTEETESKQVSAKDIKGNIISRYISPYTASLSYNNIYVKNSTNVNLDIKKIFESKLEFKILCNEEPQVLIVHTHATESFMTENTSYYTDSFSPRSRDNNKNMIKIGEIVAKKLNDAGINTLHSKTLHDYPEYTGSYTRSKETINWYLKKYPSIKIVLDLHRDSLSDGDTDKVKLVTKIDGKNAAQIMLVMGSNTGIVSNFPNWKENLKLAFKVQNKIEEKYPTLARPMMVMSKLYNQNLTTGSLLIEFGTDANNLEEVSYSAELVGNALAELLKE